ncbi:MAG: hypothetical protein ACOC8D_02290 [bacterium]
MTAPDPKPLPEWLRKELQAAPPPSDELLQRYGYLRDDFIDLVRQEAAAREEPEAVGRTADAPALADRAVDAVFTLAGQLVWVVTESLERRTPGRGQMAFAPRGTAQPGAERAAAPVDCVAKPVGDARIEVATFRRGTATNVEVNVLRGDDGTEVRPFTVTVRDAEGNRLEEPLSVQPNEQAPRFPRPSQGSYVFDVSWPDGEGEIRVDFVARR